MSRHIGNLGARIQDNPLGSDAGNGNKDEVYPLVHETPCIGTPGQWDHLIYRTTRAWSRLANFYKLPCEENRILGQFVYWDHWTWSQ